MPDTVNPAPGPVPVGHRLIPKPPQRLWWALGVSVPAMVVAYLFLPEGFDELQRRMLCIFILCAVLWALEAIPLFATALLAIGLLGVFVSASGGLADRVPGIGAMPVEAVAFKEFLSPFASNTIFLFMGGLLISRALEKHGIDKVLAGHLLQPLTRRPAWLLAGVLGITACFSMWMSNTASTAMMLAILAPILKQVPEERFRRALALAVPFGANIGGIGTPIGTPPNVIAFAAINQAISEGVLAGAPLTFLRWMMFAVPLMVLLLGLCFAVIYVSHRPQQTWDSSMPHSGRISWYGWLTIGVLVTTVILWLTSDPLPISRVLIGLIGLGLLLAGPVCRWTGRWHTSGKAMWAVMLMCLLLTGLMAVCVRGHGMASGTVALLGAVTLAALNVLSREDINHIDWDVLILMWGGLALGVGLQVTGLTDKVGALPLTQLPLGVFGIMLVLVAGGMLMSTFMSNTAAANLLVPVALALPLLGMHPQYAVVLTALGCSFAMALPVSTPPNALAFATRQISMRSMVAAGLALSLGAVAMVLAGYAWVLPAVLGS